VVRSRLCLMALLAVCTLAVRADVSLPSIFSDNMVVQGDSETPVWGKAEAGEEVTVTLAGKTQKVKTDADGKWATKIDTPKAGVAFEMTIEGKNKIVIKNCLAGEVWVCSGQSNMEWSVKASANPDQEAANAKYPNIRMFIVKKAVADTPQWNCEGSWVVCSPETVSTFSAVGYYFGRHLHQTLNVPVGLIHTSWGGTPAESWTSKPALKADPEYQPIFDRFDQKVKDYPKAKENFPNVLKKWEEAAAKAKAEGKQAPNKPRPPSEPEKDSWKPAGLFNAMLNPIIPFRIKGAIWYQGESNAGRAYQYRTLFATMIEDWRKHWNQGEFPFLWVQLANFMGKKTEPGDSAWAELREAQQYALALPHTGTGLAIDIGEEKDIHPKNKQDVGKRLALGALKIAYGKDIPFSGPLLEKARFESGAAKLTFKHAYDGLKLKDGKGAGFAVAGEDKKFHWAEVKVEGKDTLIITSSKVSNPVAVRYAWADNPDVSLYNSADLPASPFRTDNWDGITKGKN
jgi:sialate O-acetylesterase